MEYLNRKNSNSCKWDGLKIKFGEEGLLPLWVADMDFKAPACITDALHRYVDLPLGYFQTPDSYYDSFIEWEKKYHGYEVKKDWILYSPGVVPAIYWGVNCLTKPGDGIIVLTPVYYPFMDAVNNNSGRNLVKCDLVRKGTTFEIDFARFEQDIVNNKVKLFILCNPHNPVGRVWTEDELRKLLDICRKCHVMVISDEIHQDFVNPSLGRKKITAAKVGDYDDILITMTSASKSFNIAAVQNSFVIIPDEKLRVKFADFQRSINVKEASGFGCIAVEAAYRFGRPWLDELIQVIYGNFEYVKERFANECPKITVFDLEGTYLLWLDFSAFFSEKEKLQSFLQSKCKIAFDYGEWFGGEHFDSFARMNLATSRENIAAACDRIITELRKL